MKAETQSSENSNPYENSDINLSDPNSAELKSKSQKWWQKRFNQIIIAILLLLSIVFLIWAFWPKNTNSIEKTSQLITVIKEKGEASFKVRDDQTYSNIDAEEVQVPSGSTIKTGLNSLAHVLMPDNSLISLDKETEIKVEITDSGSKFNQLIGSTWHRVEKVSSGKYIVETSTTLATVRGTIFGVELSEKPEELSGIYLIESKVDVTSKLDNSTTELSPSNFVEVGSKEAGGIVRKGNLRPVSEQGRWYSRNSFIDNLWKKRLSLSDILKFKESTDLATIDSENKLPTLKENCLTLLEEKNRDGAVGATLEIQSGSTGKTLPNKSSVSAKAITYNPCRKGPFPSANINWKLNNLDKPVGETVLLENLEAGDYNLAVEARDGSYKVAGSISFKIEQPILVKANPTVPKTIVNITPNTPAPLKPINQSPVATISTPSNGSIFAASYPFSTNAVGDPYATVTFNGLGTDPEDGNLGTNNLIWKINGVEFAKGNSVTKKLTTPGTCGSNTNYVIELTAVDNNGLASVPVTITISVQYGTVC